MPIPPPPWFLRAVPGLGLAVAGAYVGWKLLEHLQQQEQLRKQAFQEHEILLSEGRNGVGNNNSDIDRCQLCSWLGLPSEDALDFVADEQLPLLLEALSFLNSTTASTTNADTTTTTTRTMFLDVYAASPWLQQDPEEMEQWIHIFERLSSSQENDNHDDESRMVSLSLAEQCVLLISQIMQLNNTNDFTSTTCTPPQSLLVALRKALQVCPEDMERQLLDCLAVLEKQNELQFILHYIFIHSACSSSSSSNNDNNNDDDDNSLDMHVFSLVEALLRVATCNHYTNGIDDGETMSTGQEEEEIEASMLLLLLFCDLLSFLSTTTTTTITAGAASVKPSKEHAAGLIRSCQLCPLSQTSFLLQKLHALSRDKLLQITLCCARFEKQAVFNLLQTALNATAKSSQASSTSSSSLCSSSSSSSSALSAYTYTKFNKFVEQLSERAKSERENP